MKHVHSLKNYLIQKRLTINFLLVFIGITLFSSCVNLCSAQSTKAAETYKTYIKQADLAFEAQDYEDALLLYEKASQARPEYNYAINRINETKKILDANADPKARQTTENKTSSTSYKTLLAKAERALAAQDYAGALLLYEKAHLTKPDYHYATDKIDEINEILNATPDTKAQLLDDINQKAESLYKQKDYKQAKTEYEKALLIDPSAQIPKERLEQISSEYIDPDDMANFNLAIANGDKELAISDFDHAITFYEAALALHPNTKFVKEKIADAKKQKAEKLQIEQSAVKLASADKLLQSEGHSAIADPKQTPGANGSQLQSEQKKYDDALANAENSLKSADYQAAIIGFKSASAIKPAEIYPKTKIAEVEKLIADNNSRNEAFDIAIKNGDQSLSEKKYDIALSYYRNALSLFPNEKYPSQKIEEITVNQKETQENYSRAIAEADKQFNDNRFEDALSSYTKALAFKPSETYPQQKITEAQNKLAELKSKDENYASAIASGDRHLSASNYIEALKAYELALSIKPNEAYPAEKTAGINAILAKQKSDSDNYAQAIRTGEKALAAGNLSLALSSFQDAQKIKPSESYPMEQINEIKAETANQQKKDAKYIAALKTGDQLFAGKDYNGALASYTEASELKKNEKYPQDQIAKTNKMISDSRSDNDNYTIAIAEGDRLFGMKDYSGANTAYAKASEIKPAETYPKQRIIETTKIMEGITTARSSEYNKAIEKADKLYKSKVFDQAIDAYEAAAKLNPGDTYPGMQIDKIREYMSDHAILDLNSQALLIHKGDEKKFAFSAIDPSLRKNNYILLKARSTSKTAPKVFLNYGKDSQKNGGIVLRNLDKSAINDLLINISIQDKWFREENNWISLSVESGDIEITKIQIAAGD